MSRYGRDAGRTAPGHDRDSASFHVKRLAQRIERLEHALEKMAVLHRGSVRDGDALQAKLLAFSIRSVESRLVDLRKRGEALERKALTAWGAAGLQNVGAADVTERLDLIRKILNVPKGRRGGSRSSSDSDSDSDTSSSSRRRASSSETSEDVYFRSPQPLNVSSSAQYPQQGPPPHVHTHAVPPPYGPTAVPYGAPPPRYQDRRRKDRRSDYSSSDSHRHRRRDKGHRSRSRDRHRRDNGGRRRDRERDRPQRHHDPQYPMHTQQQPPYHHQHHPAYPQGYTPPHAGTLHAQAPGSLPPGGIWVDPRNPAAGYYFPGQPGVYTASVPTASAANHPGHPPPHPAPQQHLPPPHPAGSPGSAPDPLAASGMSPAAAMPFRQMGSQSHLGHPPPRHTFGAVEQVSPVHPFHPTGSFAADATSSAQSPLAPVDPAAAAAAVAATAAHRASTTNAAIPAPLDPMALRREGSHAGSAAQLPGASPTGPLDAYSVHSQVSGVLPPPQAAPAQTIQPAAQPAQAAKVEEPPPPPQTVSICEDFRDQAPPKPPRVPSGASQQVEKSEQAANRYVAPIAIETVVHSVAKLVQHVQGLAPRDPAYYNLGTDSDAKWRERKRVLDAVKIVPHLLSTGGIAQIEPAVKAWCVIELVRFYNDGIGPIEPYDARAKAVLCDLANIKAHGRDRVTAVGMDAVTTELLHIVLDHIKTYCADAENADTVRAGMSLAFAKAFAPHWDEVAQKTLGEAFDTLSTHPIPSGFEWNLRDRKPGKGGRGGAVMRMFNTAAADDSFGEEDDGGFSHAPLATSLTSVLGRKKGGVSRVMNATGGGGVDNKEIRVR